MLVRESAGADLLVVDAPRSLTRTGDRMPLRRLTAAAVCPVVVMPAPVAGGEPSWLVRAARRLGEGALRSVGTAGRPGLPPVPPT